MSDSDSVLNEVAQLRTLDGRPAQLEYSTWQWLQTQTQPEPPPREPTPEQFHGTPETIEQNEAMIHAFKSAPHVLYDRYCQFGQLGVLGWCSEFSELIDDLKQLGFSGNMAHRTREVALQTCRDILKLELNVEMQLIILYLSSQISRLRTFLDVADPGDYPVPNFPLPSDDYR